MFPYTYMGTTRERQAPLLEAGYCAFFMIIGENVQLLCKSPNMKIFG